MEQPIAARCIVEILGAPKEFIQKALKEHVDKLKADKLKIDSAKYAEPIQKDTMFSQYVELVISFKDAQQLLNFCFDSMPSSVEILSPEKIELPMTALEDVLNDFQAKLHHADSMLKNLTIQKQVLDRNAVNILHNFIRYLCKEKPRTQDELATLLGMKPEDVTKFLDGLTERNILKKEGSKYSAQ